jgi:SAM-dependent methyltransferase
MAVRGKRGLEIGGPSAVFTPDMPNAYVPAIYALAASVDNSNFASNTTWSKGEAGRTFQYLPSAEPGMQYIHDATDLSSIADNAYDFLLASHILEHVANPLGALEEFRRVLKPRGHILVLVPNRTYTFDHHRPFTTFEHLEEDRAANRDEHDLTHLAEILALHDLAMDPPAGTPAEFRERCLLNFENRCMHHVFDVGVLERALSAAGFRPRYCSERWDHHVLGFGRKV